MRFEVDKNGYVSCILYGCYTGSCMEYTGRVPNEPEAYEDIDDWADRAKTQAYYLDHNGNLAYDANRAAALPEENDSIRYTDEQLEALGITDAIQAQINATIYNAIYPVGSIYISVNPTNPATLFGGTWEQIEDRFLLAAGSTYAAGSKGGTASHKHVAPIGYESTSQYIGTLNVNGLTQNFSTAGGYNSVQRTTGGSNIPSGVAAYYTETVSNIPPYLAVYVWRRVESSTPETNERFLDSSGNTFKDANANEFIVEVG